jgi:GNAT superfamily N-acetyltransferase
MKTAIAIRAARWPDDKPSALSFIAALQHFEHAFEPDRRIDDQVAEDYFDVLMTRVAKHEGRVFVAERGGEAIGWAVFVMEQNRVYVIEEERRFGQIAELFVSETMRGKGVGRALIEACENEARGRGLEVIMIGVMSRNTRAASIYADAGYAPYSAELRKYL